jgi:hypothetical protein
MASRHETQVSTRMSNAMLTTVGTMAVDDAFETMHWPVVPICTPSAAPRGTMKEVPKIASQRKPKAATTRRLRWNKAHTRRKNRKAVGGTEKMYDALITRSKAVQFFTEATSPFTSAFIKVETIAVAYSHI